jgi:hypothetical protein
LKIQGYGTIDGEEVLDLPSGLEARHVPFSLVGALMGAFRPVMQRAMLSMFHGKQKLPLRCAIAPLFIGLYHTRHVGLPLEQLAEESYRGGLTRRRSTRIASTMPICLPYVRGHGVSY